MVRITPKRRSTSAHGGRRVAATIRYHLFRREELWFDVPETGPESGAASGNGWLLAGLPMAFELGEPLRIDAPVDPQLLANAEKLQRVWADWFPERKPVPIIAPTAEPERTAPDRTGLFFSNGADSFFSLLHFEPQAREHSTNGQTQIDDLIFVWGFDIPLTNRPAFERKAAAVSHIAARLGKTPIIAATNLRQTRLRKLDWGTRLHGVEMGAVAYLSGRPFKTVLVSTSRSERDLKPWGSNGTAIPLMSSSACRVLCYGSQLTRFEKICQIVRSDLALEHLHVCWEDASDRNCGQCEKCIRSLVTLELLGKRDRAASFPQNDFSLDRLRKLQLKNRLIVEFWMELRDAARRHSRTDVLGAIDACFEANSIRA